ncbi:MAG: hypothetical protein FWC10_02850 [Lentimicrobiaceae bacterium]|nr:hypothetical protein [Lentimicrobiaceae bacterium]
MREEKSRFIALKTVLRWIGAVLFFIFLNGNYSIKAQSTEGTDFWITFEENNSHVQIKIICGNQSITGAIYVTHLGVSDNFTIDANSIYTYSIDNPTKKVVMNTSEKISNKSIHITTDYPVIVYALYIQSGCPEATNILPTTSLGIDYYQISYTPGDLLQKYHGYTVVATKDNTKLYHDNMLVATIDIGQVYYRTSNSDMTGAHITANHPIALFTHSSYIEIPHGYGYCSVMEQLPPVNIWGNDFFVPVSHRTRDIVRIVVSQNNTTITQTGGTLLFPQGGQTSFENLQAGQFIELEVNINNHGCYIQTDKPVGVCTYFTGGTYKKNITGIIESNPAQCWLPPIRPTVTDALITPFVCSPELNKYHNLLITTTVNKNNTTVSIGGASATNLNGGTWVDHIESGISFYNMPLSNLSDSYLYANSEGLIVLCYATGEYESYYFPAYPAITVTAFYANNIYYNVLENHTFCPDHIAFRAQVAGMNNEPGSLKWYINDIEQPAIQDSLTWSKYFSTGEYEIQMKIRYTNGDSAILQSILKVGYEISATPSPPTGGNIKGDGCYNIDDEVMLTATPNFGYNFVKWTEGEDDLSTNDTLKFSVTNSRSLVAHFELKKYNVILSANPPEYGTVSGADTAIPHGTTVTVHAIPNAMYKFLYWSENGDTVSLNASYTFDIIDNRTLVAHFAIKTYDIILLAYPIQAGTTTGGDLNIPHGSIRTISATANEHFYFVNWTENGVPVSMDSSFTFTVTESRTLTANFEQKLYSVTIEASPPDYGYTKGTDIYYANSRVLVEAIPNNCYRFANWSINGVVVSVENPYIFIIKNNVNLVANFYALDFDTYSPILWDNTFLLDLRKLREDGYEITGCKWFKNDIELIHTNTINIFSYSAGPYETDLLELSPTWYMFQLVTENFGTLCSTKKMITEHTFSGTEKLFVYPNPVLSGMPFTIEGVSKGSSIHLYNYFGACVGSVIATDDAAKITCNLPTGIYFIITNQKVTKIMVIE